MDAAAKECLENTEQEQQQQESEVLKELLPREQQLDPMSECDTLAPYGRGILNYQSMESGEPRQINDEGVEEPDSLSVRDPRAKKHRRKRTRYVSQGSTTPGGRRLTITGRTPRKARRRHGPTAPPRHVHCNDWREMLNITRQKDEIARFALKNEMESFGGEVEELRAVEAGSDANENGLVYPPPAPVQHATTNLNREKEATRARYISGGSSVQCDWIEETFCKRECCQFIASSRDTNKCCCGLYKNQHSKQALDHPVEPFEKRSKRGGFERWSIQRHTVLAPTDAYGTIEFQGGPHPFKAQYLRLSFDSDPADIMCLFERVWQLDPPKLIITVHGGMTNFDLQPKLARVFRKGLLKAARTTGAWIFTSGIDAGVMRQVSAALESAVPTSRMHNKIVSVGIAPWGLVKRREDFIGRDKVVLYHPQSFPPKTRFAVLNNRHSYFLLVDNGCVGRYGADIILRRRFESYIAEKQKICGGTRSVPVVCVVLEGGTCTIRTVLDYVTTLPKVPVVICDGSGRASDLLAFAHQYIQEDGNLPEGIRPQLLSLIEDVFFYDKHNAQCLVMDILACVRQRNLITVFRLGENQKHDVDYAILTALLKGHNLSAAEQLSLALAWNRVDIARSDIFVMGQDWPKAALHNAMLEALIHNRVDFVRLLLENGVSMHDFLTIARLEELYNTDQGPPNTLYYIVRDVVKIRAGYRYRLPHIGMAIEKLMANGFRSHYTSAQFRDKYSEYRNKLKEAQRRMHSQASDEQVPTSPSNYHRTGSEFFSRGFFRNLPPSASETRLGESVPKAHETAGNGPQPKVSVTGGAPPLRHNLSMQPQANSFATGSRALSNHILWRTAYRRDVNHPTGGKQSSRTPPPFNRDGLTEAVEYAMEVDDKQHGEQEHHESDFRYPFSDLLVWAVLTKRHEMALCMWQHGEEAMAKALVACRLYKSLAKEAAEDYLEVEVCEELKKYADEFRQLSLDLLDYCYKQDDAQTLQLLTYELTYWGHETCLSLAVIVNNKQFLAHPCCQILLADLWHGGLRIRSNSNLKVIMGILFAPSIFLLEFKSREELMLQPQTAAEHQNDINDTSSSSSESSSSSSSSESETDDEREKNDESDVGDKGTALGDRRRISHGSMQSLNFASIFQSKRRRHKASQYASSAGANANREDIEMGKQRNREPNHEAKDTSRSRPLATQGYKDRVEARGGAVRDLVAQSTLGAAISAASSAGGSPLMVHQLPTTGLTPPESFSSFRPSPTSSPTVATRAQQSLGVENSIKSQSEAVHKKSAPHFVLGSIGENVADSNNEEGYISTVSSPRNQRANNHITTPAASPRQRQENSKRPGSPPHYGSPTRWDLARSGGLAKAIDQLGRLTHIGGEQVPKGIPLPEGVTLNKKRQIKFRRKLYEFFVAPITTFWAWALSFLVFLSILTYVLLIRTPSKPTYLEWYLFAYVIAFGLEIVRKFFMSEPKKIKEKFEYFFGNYWNFITSLAIIVFIIGFGFRLHTPTSKSIGRIILAVDSVLWSIKLLDFLGVHPRFGPYITMAGKMVMNMSSIVVMLGISLLGFGLARQSITYPNEEWHWLLLRNVFYKPYFMLYGEVYADEIDTCGDEAWDEHLDKNISISNAWTHRDDRARELACVPGHWIPPILMTVFLLIANILLISMLIAIFNNIFESTNKISQQIWLFQRYRQVMEYEATPFLPPPFTPVYHLYMFFKYLNYRSHPCACFRSITRNLCFACCARGQSDKDSACEECADGRKVPNQLPKNAYEQRRNLGNGSGNHKEGLALFDFSLKLFLSDDQVEKLHDFEEECMEDLAREKEYERNRTAEERLHRTCERTELILLRVNDLASKETMLKGNVRELETRLDLMESRQSEMLDCLRQIGTALPALVQSIQSLQQQVAGVGPPGLVRTDSVTPLAMSDEPPDQREERADGRYLVAHSEGQLALQDAEQMRPGKSASAILPAAARDKRAQSAQSHVLEQDVPGSTVSSSMSTVYYPLKGGTQQGSGSNLHGADQSNAAAAHHHHHQRTRTTTIAGNEYPSSSHSGAGNDVGLTPSGRQKRLFGSMASLEPSGMAAGPTSKKMSSLQPKKSMSTKRRHRQNDEYTSITDAISIEYEEASMSIQIPTFSSQLEAETEEGENANDGEEKSTQQQRELAVDAGLQTEEEEEDEEEYMEEEDEDEDEEDEELLDEEAGRSPKRMSRERAGRKAGVQIDIEIDTASLCFDGDEDGDRISSRRARPFSELMDDAEMEEGFPRVATPNSTLRRARSSFVQRQNTLFKSYEEAVGRPSYEMQGTSAEAVKKRKSVSEADQLAPEGQGKAGEPGKGDASSNSSKEFITFGAAQGGEPQEQK